MPARLTFAIRLGSLILLVVSLTSPTWATEAADVERAAKRLRAQTYRQYRYDRREYDRRMEPVDRALADWRAKGSPAGEADRFGRLDRYARARPRRFEKRRFEKRRSRGCGWSNACHGPHRAAYAAAQQSLGRPTGGSR